MHCPSHVLKRAMRYLMIQSKVETLYPSNFPSSVLLWFFQELALYIPYQLFR